jgi:rod shape determining protein RodA
MNILRSIGTTIVSRVDWWLLLSAIAIASLGLITMYSFNEGENYFFKQLLSLTISVAVFLVLSLGDFRFLKHTRVVMIVYVGIIVLLGGLFLFGTIAKGSQSWFRVGGFSLQPADYAKIALVVLLAKYFSRRHIEIKRIRHILVSGFYAFSLFIMIALQPDFGSAMIIFFIWLGMVLVSGISYKHLLSIVLIGTVTFAGLWFFAFKDYQKSRIATFINPLADIRGAGYNAYQSMVAVGSGQVLGKGVGYGTQSRLQYLPEHQTDFIFASFAEEWGLVGTVMLYILFGIVFWRLMLAAYRGASNFETLFALGTLIFFSVHMGINVGMNMGMLPVTGVPLPFMSYGGSHLLAEFIMIGLVSSMRAYERPVRQDMLRDQPELLISIK